MLQSFHHLEPGIAMCVAMCVAVCCSVLQCAAVSPYVVVCCSVLQCAAVCPCVVVYCSVLQHVVLYCGVLYYITVLCSVLQCVAMCCSVIQCVAPVVSSYILSCIHLHTVSVFSSFYSRFVLILNVSYFRCIEVQACWKSSLKRKFDTKS